MKLFKSIFTCVFFLISITALSQENTIPSDKEISYAVEQEMQFNKTSSSYLIDVSTKNGIVTLTGKVNNMLEMDKAVQIARTVKGVRGVINQIEVLAPERPDDELKEDINQAIIRDPATQISEISIEVINGMVTLNGMVESWQEKMLVSYVVKGVRGVKGITNNIIVDSKTQRSDFDIENDIKEAIRYDVRVDGALIDVSVVDGRVSLSGVVGSVNERVVANALAWTNGVASVDDSEISVEEWARKENLRMQKYNIKTDAEIKEAILDAFTYDPRVASFNPDVSVRDGDITLSGTVTNLKAKRAAENDAKNIVGVERVKNYIKVRTENIPKNDKLTASIQDAFLRDPMIEGLDIVVSANNGVVYLNGKVDSYYEKFYAEDLASEEEGVVAIENSIEVRDDDDYHYYDYYDWNSYFPIYQVDSKTTYMDDENLKKEIEDRLWWSPYINQDEITVEVDNGTAILSGTVKTRREKKQVLINALEAGSKDVKNNILVQKNNK